MSNSDVAFGLVVFCILMSYGLLTLLVFFLRKDYYPLTARAPFLAVIHQVGYVYNGVNFFVWLLRGYQGPCLLYHWLKLTGDIILAAPYIVRLFQLTFKFKITQEILARHGRKNYFAGSNEVVHYGWFTDHQRYITPRYLILLIFVVLGGAIPLCGLFTLAYPSLTNFSILASDPNCPLLYSLTQNKFFAVAGFLLLGGIFLSSLKIKEIEEGLWIKREFLVAIVICTIQFAIMFIPELNNRHAVEAIGFLIAMIGWMTATFTIPIILSFFSLRKRPKRRRKATFSQTSKNSTDSSHVPRLENYLLVEAQYQAFWKFLAKEFAVENILFWKDIQTIRNFTLKHSEASMDDAGGGQVVSVALTKDGSVIPSSNVAVYQMLQDVGRSYIALDAAQPLNISHQARKSILDRLKSLSAQSVITAADIDSIFSVGIREVIDMLELDPYVRFSKSEFYVAPDDILASNSAHTEDTDASLRSIRESTLPDPSASVRLLHSSSRVDEKDAQDRSPTPLPEVVEENEMLPLSRDN